MGAAKKLDERSLEVLELPNERELGLAKNFDDPALGELIPGLKEAPGPGGVVEETAAAVHQLVREAQQEPAALFGLDLTPGEEAISGLRGNMAGRLFELVACERSFDELVRRMLEAIMDSVGARVGSVLEFDGGSGEFFFRASIGGGDPEQVKAFRVPANKGIVGHVAETREPLLLASLESDEIQLKAISLSVGFEANTCLAVPLLVAGQLYGVVELFNRGDGSPFGQEDLESAREGAVMAAKVLEVRFLMAELARRMR